MNLNTIIQGDCLQTLKTFPDECVNCVVTSPPYWGLRDYGTATWEGGRAGCDHKGKPFATKANINRNCGTGDDVKNSEDREFFKEVCGKCGAKRIDQQLGLEKTPEEYVAKMVEIFREVRRVLRDDGTLWLNLGDSYWGGKGQSGQGSAEYQEQRKDVSINKPYQHIGGSKLTRPTDGKHSIIKPKDLVGIPWMVAFALRADGWYLRQDIIWAKPNPMPESVTDRCTKSHEYIFLMSKSAKYYFDGDAIKEKAVWDLDGHGTEARKERQLEGMKSSPTELKNGIRRRKFGANKQEGTLRNDTERYFEDDGVRNKRSVWTVTTKPFSGAHFATFPEDLILPCILAGCPPGGTVLDPFMGAGTTALVAKKNGCNYVGCELNPKYIEIAEKRLSQEYLDFKETESKLEGK